MKRSLLAIVVILSVAAHVSPASAGDPVDLSGTWATAGTAKFKIQKGDKVEGALFTDISFGPATVPLLASDQVEVIMDDNVLTLGPVAGTYFEKKPGRGKPTVNLNGQEFGDALLDLVLVELGPLPIGVTVSIPIDKLKVKAKAKSKNGIETMKLKVVAKGRLEISGGGLSESVKLKFRYRGEGAR